MDLFYPQDFPEEAKNNVIHAVVLARRTLEQACAKWTKYNNGRLPSAYLLQYILSIFAAFAQEACAIGKQNGSGAIGLTRSAGNFSTGFREKAAKEQDYEQYGLPYPCGNVNSHELNRSFRQMVEWSKEWAKFEDDLLEVARGSSTPVVDEVVVVGSAEAPTPSSLHGHLAEREALLAEYKSATGQPSNRQIYTAKNSGIHKPEFYQWMKGSLPATSQTAINFERFLQREESSSQDNPRSLIYPPTSTMVEVMFLPW